MTTSVKRKISQAKLTLMTRRGTTFFSSLLSSLHLVVNNRVPAAGTDGVTLWLNPNFVDKMTVGNMLFVLLHEVWHVLLEHPARCAEQGLNQRRYNQAGDFYINGKLKALGFELPPNNVFPVLLDSRFNGMSTRQIYDILEQEDFPLPPKNDPLNDVMEPQDGDGDGNDSGDGSGQGSRARSMTRDEKLERMKGNIIKAATAAQMANDWGSVPGDIKRKLERMLNPKLPWNILMQNYAFDYAQDDYTMAKPHRLFWPEWYLPSLESEGLGHTFFGIDVSASMTQPMLNQIYDEITYVWDMLKPKSMRLIGFDTAIRDDLLFNEFDDLENVSLTGGGGTVLQPIINRIAKEEPVFAFIFTDGEFLMPDLSQVHSDLYWVILGSKKINPPVGTVIYVDD